VKAIPVYFPTVSLFEYTKEPVKVIASAWKAMHGQYLVQPSSIGIKSATDAFQEIIRHQHKTVLEYAHFVFGLEDVSRAFQQQLTRHRVGVSFSIQSLRQVNLVDNFKYVVPHGIRGDEISMIMFQEIMDHVKMAYDIMSERMVVEDARGILPLNICSNITMSINYRALFEMANQRFCKTTQGEFQDVMENIRTLVCQVSPLLGVALMSQCEYTKVCNQGRWSCGKFPT